MIAATTAPTTARGHNRIARPANGTQTVSKNGPSLPIKSSNSLFHPLNNMNGLFHKASAVIRKTSTGTPTRVAKRQLGSFDNLVKTRQNISERFTNIFSAQSEGTDKGKFLLYVYRLFILGHLLT